MMKNFRSNIENNTDPESLQQPCIKLCVPQYLTFPGGRVPKYSVLANLVQEHNLFPFGSMARSGILIRSVLKQNIDGSSFLTLGFLTALGFSTGGSIISGGSTTLTFAARFALGFTSTKI